jgi:hypothetical protein
MALVTNCPGCGAQVDASPRQAAYVYTCRFCQTRTPISPLSAPPAPVRAVTARAVRTGARAVGCFITLTALVPVALGIGISVYPLLSKYVSARFGDFPIAVPPNDSVEIADRTATGTDTLVTVGVNGKVTLRRCHLKGPLIVKAGTNAEVTIVDSTLEGQTGVIEGEINVVVNVQGSTITSGEEILDAPVNAKVYVSKESKLAAAGVAFPLEANGEVSIDHSTVEGKIGGVEIKANGHVKMTGGAVLRSDGPAIDLPMNGHLALTSSRVESKTTAIHAGSNLEGTLRGMTLVGPHAALDVGTNARLTVAQTTLAGPKKLGASSTLDER